MAKHKAAASGKDVEEGKVFAFLATFLSIIGFIIVVLTKKDNKYAMFYAKQGLVLFIAAVIVGVASWILIFIPIIGWLAMIVLELILLVLWKKRYH
jgi:uncharacterized membrane protein